MRNVRLTSAELAGKSTQGPFRAFFHSHKLYWTSPIDLDNFELVTQPDRLGLRLRDLTISGQVPPADEFDGGPDRSGITRELACSVPDLVPRLTRAFTNLVTHSSHNGLESLTLAVDIPAQRKRAFSMCGRWRYYKGNWRPVWEQSAETFRLTLQALARSKLPIGKLDVYGSTPGCSLAIDQIRLILDRVDLAPNLSALNEISLSVSHRVSEATDEGTHDDDRKDSVSDSPAEGESFAMDVARLLKLCPAVSTMHLHWYNLRTRNVSSAQEAERHIFKYAAGLDYPSLKNVELAGIWCDSDSLL